MPPAFQSVQPAMPSPESERQLSISAAASLAGVTTHTLRKWESRHGVVVPQRTQSGRRYYSEGQVTKLKLIKILLEHGHSLTHLADLNESELGDLAKRHRNTEVVQDEPADLVIVGPNLTRRLTEWGDATVTAYPQDGVDWLQDQLDGRHQIESHDVLVIEVDTLPQALTDQLVALKGSVFDRIVVIASVTSRRTRRQLRMQDIVALDSIVPESAVLALVGRSAQPVQTAPKGPQRFSKAELAAVAAMAPKLDCECPNHIAQLLLDISAFEKYSLECEDTDPAEQALHAYLGEITGQARRLFETALVAVAEADNLEISTLV